MNHSQLVRDRVFNAAGSPIAAERWTIDGVVDPHSHDFMEIAVVQRGTGLHRTADCTTGLTPGLVVSVRPGQWHAWLDCVGAEVVNFYLGPELFGADLGWVLDLAGLAQLMLHGGQTEPGLTAERLDRVLSWLDQLAAVTPVRGTPSAALALGLASCALAEIATATGAVSGSAPPATISPVVRRALLLLAERLDHPWRVPELAARAGVSVPHLHRLFADEVGSSPMAWLDRSRVERATSLLLGSNLPVARIGARVGWQDPNHFSRRFRGLTGLSPSAYRTQFAHHQPHQ